MFLKYPAFLLLVSLSNNVFPFQCYITLVKDSCWTNYNVQVKVINSDDNKIMSTVEAPKGKTWARQPFDCNPGMKLMYSASFSPVFWQSEEGKTYEAIRYWTLPDKVGDKESAWDIPVCFASAFSGVPFPPDAVGDCRCDLLDIPPVPPSKLKS
ncbi:MAG: hypothetical protein H0T84_07565 [Tatlockia sp.]|nr:hypothetical protein [Tatlockia sp.]